MSQPILLTRPLSSCPQTAQSKQLCSALKNFSLILAIQKRILFIFAHLWPNVSAFPKGRKGRPQGFMGLKPESF
jgi:hypothetical protein